MESKGFMCNSTGFHSKVRLKRYLFEKRAMQVKQDNFLQLRSFETFNINRRPRGHSLGPGATEHGGVSPAIWDAQFHGIQNSDITKTYVFESLFEKHFFIGRNVYLIYCKCPKDEAPLQATIQECLYTKGYLSQHNKAVN